MEIIKLGKKHIYDENNIEKKKGLRGRIKGCQDGKYCMRQRKRERDLAELIVSRL